MRVGLVDSVYNTVLSTDENDSLFGLKLAPFFQFAFDIVGTVSYTHLRAHET